MLWPDSYICARPYTYLRVCARYVCRETERGWLLSSGTQGFKDTQAKSVNEHMHTHKQIAVRQ